MLNPRLCCAGILQKILEEKVFFAELKKNVSTADLPFVNMLVLTSLRHYNRIKTLLYQNFLHKKIPHKHRIAEYLLITAIAEVLYLNTPPHAVINETVSNIKKSSDNFIGGLANAVLRKIVTRKEEVLANLKKISVFPSEFRQILQGYSSAEIEQIGDVATEIPPLDISCRQNILRWQKELNALLLPNGSLRLYDADIVQKLPGYVEGQWWIQDVAAALPVAAMGDQKGKKVLDLCAAPGGKTAQLLARGAEVTALDISKERLNILSQNMQRLHFNKIHLINDDALHYLTIADEKYDAILLDAPCSASGTFRRHPEVLHIKTKQDVAQQVCLQRQILDKCCQVLKIGGILLYSVCSISKAEGEQQIANFLQENKRWQIVPIKPEEISLFGLWNDNLITKEGYIRTLPFYLKSQKGMDSFFICKMQRII